MRKGMSVRIPFFSHHLVEITKVSLEHIFSKIEEIRLCVPIHLCLTIFLKQNKNIHSKRNSPPPRDLVGCIQYKYKRLWHICLHIYRVVSKLLKFIQYLGHCLWNRII